MKRELKIDDVIGLGIVALGIASGGLPAAGVVAFTYPCFLLAAGPAWIEWAIAATLFVVPAWWLRTWFPAFTPVVMGLAGFTAMTYFRMIRAFRR